MKKNLNPLHLNGMHLIALAVAGFYMVRAAWNLFSDLQAGTAEMTGTSATVFIAVFGILGAALLIFTAISALGWNEERKNKDKEG